MTLAAGTRLGRYEIRELLGAGGMGEVYVAHDPKVGRDVAIKVLPAGVSADAGRLQRFEQEAQAAGALNHPNVLAIYDVETHDGSPYVVSELLEGQTLRELMAGAPLSPRRAVEYAHQIALGLAAAHGRGIIHRDLKPENLFVTKDGRAKILDFGLAKLTEPDGDPARTDLPTRRVKTESGAVMGTVGYMSPEQLRGQQVDARTDIFSFGAVLYEMLSGRRAFHRDSAADTISAILREDPPELSGTNREINPGLDRIVRRCLEKSREARFHSASDLAFALEALSGTQASGTAPGIAVEEAPRGAPRRRPLERLAWVAAALFLASTLALAALHFRRDEPRAETMRFTLPVPEKSSFGGSLALSPDGRRLAFVVAGGGGVTSLWMRALDSMAPRELPGTEGASFPFWSPDGRHIAFFAGGKLKKMEAAGGPVQVLAETSLDPRGGAWGADGTILFAPQFTSTLYKVSAAGGAAEPATEFDRTREQISHRWPSFLPDGRRFLFFARSPKREAEGIYVGSLDSKEGSFLLNTPLLGAYSPANASPGGTPHLLFVRERTLLAQPLDAGSLKLSGEPSAVAEGVLNFPNEGGPTAYAAFSASANGHLAYLTGDVMQTQLTWLDRSGNPQGTVASPGQYHEPSLSPDGRRVIVGREDEQMQDLWMLDAARGTTTRFTFDPSADVCSLWSPDGGSIVFSSNRGGGVFHLYQKISSGAGKDELLLRTDHNAFADDWLKMPDGRQFIIYETEYPKTRFDLYILPLDGERKPYPFLNTEFNENHAQFSPDGRWVAYASDESGRPEVYVQSFPASGAKWQVSTSGGDQPQWRRDGRELFYMAPDKRLVVVPVVTGTTFEFGVPAPLFNTRIPLTGLTEDRNNYLPFTDGQRFLLNNLLEDSNTQPIMLILNWAAEPKR